MPNPQGNDSENEWIEIYNNGNETHDISGWMLDDIDGGSNTYTFPQGTNILYGEYRVFSIKITSIALTNSGDSVRIIYPDNSIADEVKYTEKATDGESYALINNVWQWTDNPTPGRENKERSVETASNAATQKSSATGRTGQVEDREDDNKESKLDSPVETITAEEFSAQISTKKDSSSPYTPFVLGIIASLAGGAVFIFLKNKNHKSTN